jgi:ring-1,2-phenylacetyl-CoA epoxidase subunit PaaD
MVTEEEVLDALRSVLDPEMPINIVDLGIVDVVRIEPEGKVIVDILPTFVGCPALHVIEDQVRKRIAKLSGVKDVEVRIRFDPPWTVDRISGAGRDALQRVGITVPGIANEPQPRCPFCGSAAVRLESPFGPTRCRMIYHCESCRHPFEHLKRIAMPVLSEHDLVGPG